MRGPVAEHTDHGQREWPVDERTRFAVEQLEPKILLSAAPVDAPAGCCGVSDNLFVGDDDRASVWGSQSPDVVEVEAWSDAEDQVESDAPELADAEVLDWPAISTELRTSGPLQTDGNAPDAESSWVVEAEERLEGSGSFSGEIINEGLFAPGNSPGEVIVERFVNEGTLEIEIGGTSSSEFDRVIVSQDALLGGTLEIALLDGFLPQAGDEFEFLTFDSSEGDFSLIRGLQISETRYFVPTRTDGGYKLTVVDVVSLLDGGFTLDSGDNVLNQQVGDVLSGVQDLGLLREQTAAATIEVGPLEISGDFAIGQDGTYAYFLLEGGTVTISAGQDDNVRESEVGLVIEDVQLAVLYDPKMQSYAISGAGDLTAQGGTVELGGRLEVAWNTLGSKIAGREFSASGVSQTVTVDQGVALLQGDLLSASMDGAAMRFTMRMVLQDAAQETLTVEVSRAFLQLSAAQRAIVKIENVTGSLTVNRADGFALNLDGAIDTTFSGFSMRAQPVSVTFTESGEEGARLFVEGSRKDGSFLLGSARTSADFVLDIAESSEDPVPELFFAFQQASFETADAAFVDGSGVLLADINGVVSQLFGTSSATVGGFDVGGRIQVRLNTTAREVDEVVPFGDGAVRIVFDETETETNFFEVTPLSAFLEVGDFLQIRGDVTWTSGEVVVEETGEILEVRTLVNSSLEVFLGADGLVPGAWGPELGATGFLLSNAEIAIIHFVESDTYAVIASGLAEAIGAGAGSIAGRGTLSVNQSGVSIDETIEFPGRPGAGVRVFFPTSSSALSLQIGQLAIEVGGQTLEASGMVERGDGQLEIEIQGLSATFDLGTGTLGFADAGGQFFLSDDQAYGRVTGDIVQTGLEFLSLGGQLGLDFNTGTSAVQLSGDDELPAGPFVRLSGQDLNVTVAGESMTGDFTFENGTLEEASGEVRSGVSGQAEVPVLIVGADSVGISTNGFTGPEMDLDGLFILSGDWLAGDISGSFEYLEDEADIEVRGSVALSVNTYSE
ncbi:MAG: hypothetical protein CMP26_13080, partial [Roseibacillus sp.]|nr:hypothetical protein [Roseibacillus sp.]